MDNNTYDVILKVLGNEAKFYSDKNNSDWSKEKNEGFKKGIKYCENLIATMKMKESEKITGDIRRIQVLVKSKYWQDIEFMNLKPRDIFKIYDNGKRFVDTNGHDEWIVTSLPYINENGILTVDAE